MSAEDRDAIINVMIVMEGKKSIGYYERMGDEELQETYDHFMSKPEPLK